MRVAVVGAGIVGLAVTAELARLGAEVRCFEAGRPMAARSTGGTRIFRLAHTNPALVDWADRARAGWQAWSERAGTPLVGTETTVVSGDVEAFTAGLAAAGAAFSVRDTAPSGLPTSSSVLTGPFLVDPAGGVIQAERTGRLLLDDVSRLLVTGPVRALEASGEGDPGVTVVTDGGDWTADSVVVAAGAGTPALAAQVGIDVPAGLEHHVRVTFALRDPGATPPCWLERSGGWRPGRTTYAQQAAPGLWAVGGGLPGGDQDWELPVDEVVTRAKAWFGEYARDCIDGVDPEPLDTLYCSVNPDLDDGISAVRSGPVLAVWGENLFKFAPLLGAELARAALDLGGLDPAVAP